MSDFLQDMANREKLAYVQLRAQDRIAALEAQLEAAQKQAAQMRGLLAQSLKYAACARDSRIVCNEHCGCGGHQWAELTHKALNFDAGKGYVSVEQLTPLVTKWNGLADDHKISGAESEAWAQCAEDLREVLEGEK